MPNSKFLMLLLAASILLTSCYTSSRNGQDYGLANRMSKKKATFYVSPPSEFIQAITTYHQQKKVWPYDLRMVSYQGKPVSYWIDQMKQRGLASLDVTASAIDANVMNIHFIFNKPAKPETDRTTYLLENGTVEGEYLFTANPIYKFETKVTVR